MSTTVTTTEAWQRLDRRMLLVHPLREVVRFLPAMAAVVVAGTATGEAWQYLGVLVPVALGVLRYLTTRFRVGQGRVELRTGLLNRHLRATPLDRVRTVDLTSPLTHRVLGLTRLRIGTGTGDDEALVLDGLSVAAARRLRAELLREVPDQVTEPPPDTLHLDPRWARLAPFTSTGLALGAGVLGLALQATTTLGLARTLRADDLVASALRASVWIAVPALVLSGLVATSALAVGGYLVSNWDLTLRHERRAWHLRRGLLTTRETTLADDRVAGVSLGEPLGLRLAGGARLDAVVTGVDRDEQGSALLVPPAPHDVVAGVAGRVLGTDAPVTGPLVPHGPQAVRRRWTRALGPALAVLAAGLLAVATGGSPWLLAPGALALPTLRGSRQRSLALAARTPVVEQRSRASG
ncbi:PH domain-containing protein [Nocardioides dongkuii]|uniref:PH domain-containing protein n=1 Tax=Nocardioides dongkuii TaxID=2760089 RepID=UPI001878474C|nr:PH domain-containing protein [Nocardioides dongkuii]